MGERGGRDGGLTFRCARAGGGRRGHASWDPSPPSASFYLLARPSRGAIRLRVQVPPPPAQSRFNGVELGERQTPRSDSFVLKRWWRLRGGAAVREASPASRGILKHPAGMTRLLLPDACGRAKGGGRVGGGGPREGLPRALAHPRWGRRGVPAVRRSAANGAGLPGGDSADLLAAVVKSDTGSRRYCGGRPASGCMDYGDGRWGGVAVAAAAAAAAGMPRVCRPRAVAVRAM